MKPEDPALTLALSREVGEKRTRVRAAPTASIMDDMGRARGGAGLRREVEVAREPAEGRVREAIFFTRPFVVFGWLRARGGGDEARV